MSSIQPSRKKKKNYAEILNGRHATYTINTLKFDYFSQRTLRAAHILNLVVRQ